MCVRRGCEACTYHITIMCIGICLVVKPVFVLIGWSCPSHPVWSLRVFDPEVLLVGFPVVHELLVHTPPTMAGRVAPTSRSNYRTGMACRASLYAEDNSRIVCPAFSSVMVSVSSTSRPSKPQSFLMLASC